jgi:hypothetical protein
MVDSEQHISNSVTSEDEWSFVDGFSHKFLPRFRIIPEKPANHSHMRSQCSSVWPNGQGRILGGYSSACEGITELLGKQGAGLTHLKATSWGLVDTEQWFRKHVIKDSKVFMKNTFEE